MPRYFWRHRWRVTSPGTCSTLTAVFTWGDVIKAEGKMPKEENDLRDRTKDFALRIMRMFSLLPKTTEAQTLCKQALQPGTAITAKRIAAGAKPNLSPSVAIHFVSWKKLAVGLSSSFMAKLSNQPSFPLFARNATN